MNAALWRALVAGGAVLAPSSSTAAGDQQFVTSPAWVRPPTFSEATHRYPAKALRNGLSGYAVAECLVSEQGALTNCRVYREEPAGVGFGEAAMRIAGDLILKPVQLDGRPAIGRKIRFPVTFLIPTPGGLVADVDWLAAPSIADVAAAFPQKAKAEGAEGAAALSCRVGAGGYLARCRVVAEAPRNLGFGAAALKLAGAFKAPVATGDGKDLRGRLTSLNFRFGASPSAPAASPMGKVRWAAMPSTEQFASLFPDAATKTGVTGARIVLACTVGPGGALLDCRAQTEDPPILGFAAAALALAPSFRARLWTDEGLPVVGGGVRLPIRLQINEAQPTSSGGEAP